MAVVPLREILADAFGKRYGVPAINVFDDLTLEAVLAAAVDKGSPLIVQTSVKTVKSVGSDVLYAMWTAMTAGIEVPVTLHLDHCPERAVITECLRQGWNSVLFDASRLPVAENMRQTVEVVAEARRYGADVEGEIESITGVEDGIGSDTAARQQGLDVALEFLRTTGVNVFAPAIGNAHGSYRQAPVLDAQRVSDIVAAHPLPIALHGGSGLSDEQFRDLISRGCAKVNISTALKETFMKSGLAFLQAAAEKDTWDPPSLFRSVRQDVVELAGSLMTLFGSAGRAGGGRTAGAGTADRAGAAERAG
ncbi:class II fructose-bisphosphate aldolase [Actinacidiphila sp. ITFR-21]|uniref:class II fructose-bisphosphate aldolase n=1 Tax=Actinacidiphila sp. ITFR-21 TaxID=3075199 RepID=UPI00288B2D34|nr:class II fructose-bisphosphate aldolase [Streptomyces sp. ITFR-21]WNI17505.1 class II fructose-bisphosphate aldolase [Streptomyces sp. ITFR-21]